MDKKMKRWIPLLIITILISGAWFSGLVDYFNLETFMDKKEELSMFIEENLVTGIILFALVYIVSVALSLPIATTLTLMGGFMFGTVTGTIIVVLSATIGASLIFLIAKTSLGNSLKDKAGGMYNKISKNMNENAIGYMLFMRLVPAFPFFLANIAPSLFNIRFRDFFWTTFVGIIPGSFVYVNLGKELGNIESLDNLISTNMIIAFTMLGLFALIPTIYSQIKKSKSAIAFASILLFTLSPIANASAPLVNTEKPVQAEELSSKTDIKLSKNNRSIKNYNDFLSGYNQLLKENLKPSKSKNGINYIGVDYDSWQENPMHPKIRELLSLTNPDDFTERNDKLAYWINAYNFMTIDLIVSTMERLSIRKLGTLMKEPWDIYTWKLNGKDYTLGHIEHKILRRMKEPRIHFAINCASISCPDIRFEIFHPEKLEEQFEEQIKSALSNKKKFLYFDKSKNILHVNKIFRWFGKDFYNNDIKKWLMENSDLEINKDTKITYIYYDWGLNIANKEDKNEKQ